jgi:hypothetical protein
MYVVAGRAVGKENNTSALIRGVMLNVGGVSAQQVG